MEQLWVHRFPWLLPKSSCKTLRNNPWEVTNKQYHSGYATLMILSQLYTKTKSTIFKAVLQDNNYPMSFIQNCKRVLTKQPADNFHGFVVLPYVQGISEKIGRILKQQKVKVAYKPDLTINSLFPRPKELDDSDRQKSGIVYNINCTQCNFVYYCQTERSLKTRIAEHKKAVVGFDQTPKLQAMYTISVTS